MDPFSLPQITFGSYQKSKMMSEFTGPKYGNIPEFFSFGWMRMKQYFLVFFLLVFLLAILDAPLELLNHKIEDDGLSDGLLGEMIGLAYFLFLLPVFEYSVDLLFIQGVRGEKIDVKNVTIGFKNYLNIVLANLLVFGLVMMGLIVLIIPGIIIGCRLVFVSYLVMDKEMSPIEAVEESWRMTKGDYGFKIFGMAILSIFIVIGGLILFIVCVFPAIMWIKASFASLYQYVLNEQEGVVLPEESEKE